MFGIIASSINKLDPNAKEYLDSVIAAGGTYSITQQSEIHVLYKNLKGKGPNNSSVDFWTSGKVDRLWPLIGGNQSSFLIDIRLNLGTIPNGGTYNSDGLVTDGISQYFLSDRSTSDLGVTGGIGIYDKLDTSWPTNGSCKYGALQYTPRVALLRQILSGQTAAYITGDRTDPPYTKYDHIFRINNNDAGAVSISNGSSSFVSYEGNVANQKIAFGGLNEVGAVGYFAPIGASLLLLTKDLTFSEALVLRTILLRYVNNTGRS